MNDNSTATRFLPRVSAKEAVVGIFGLGYVGIPLALSVARAGLKVIGFDVAEARVEQLNGSKSPIKHISDSDIAMLIASGFKTASFFKAATSGALSKLILGQKRR